MKAGMHQALAAGLQAWFETYVLDTSLDGYENSTQFNHMAMFCLARPDMVRIMELGEHDGGHSTMLDGG